MQRRTQGKSQHRLGRNLDLLVPGKGAAEKSSRGAYAEANRRAFAPAGKSSNQRAPAGAGAGGDSSPLTLCP